MTTVEQILDELSHGVDDQTWTAHVQRLQEHGAQVLDGVNTAAGSRTAEVHFGWPDPHHVERDAAGRWFLVAPVPGTPAQP